MNTPNTIIIRNFSLYSEAIPNIAEIIATNTDDDELQVRDQIVNHACYTEQVIEHLLPFMFYDILMSEMQGVDFNEVNFDHSHIDAPVADCNLNQEQFEQLFTETYKHLLDEYKFEYNNDWDNVSSAWWADVCAKHSEKLADIFMPCLAE